jgi:hypothetical protein
MIPAGQPINEDLEARKFADVQARREPDMNTTVARAGWDGDKSSGWVDPIATTTKFAHSHDIRIDESQRVFVLPKSDGLGGRAGLIAGALITASGLAWLVISAPCHRRLVRRRLTDRAGVLTLRLKFPLSTRAIVFRFPMRLFVTRCRQAAARQPWRLLHSNPNLRPTRSAEQTR